MKKLLKVCLIATALAFVAGCAKDKPAPAPVNDKPVVKVEKKKVKKVKSDKLGKTVVKKDVKK